MNSVERSLQKIQELKSQKTLVEIECMMNKYSHVKYGNKTALEYINSMKNEKVINNLNIDLYSTYFASELQEISLSNDPMSRDPVSVHVPETWDPY